jgi:hypothetical protein
MEKSQIVWIQSFGADYWYLAFREKIEWYQKLILSPSPFKDAKLD